MGGGSESTQTTTAPPPTAAELHLQDLDAQEKELQIKNLQAQSDFQTKYAGQIGTQLDAQSAYQNALNAAISPEDQASAAKSDFDRAQKLGPIQDELLQLQLDAARQGGRATDAQKADIGAATDASIKAGTGDIDIATGKGLDLIADELANSRGLRFGDSPITREGSFLVDRANTQKSSLINNLRANQANAVLNYPLAVQGLQGQQNQQQQSLLTGVQDFQTQLRQQAFQNRLALTGQVSQSGLGLASIGSGPGAAASMQQGRLAQSTTSGSTSNVPGLAQYGQFASGIGSAMSIFSDRNAKEALGSIDAEQLLGALEWLPVEAWRYLGDKTRHVGPYAQDFKEAFALGDGKSIPVVDAVGVLFAAVKALAMRMREFEHGPAFVVRH